MESDSRATKTVANTELYDRWAKVYDTDGNILQSIDDHMLPSLFHQAFSIPTSRGPLEITELGCGTGRNTAKLLSPEYIPETASIGRIHALDLSPGMLEIARTRCSDAATSQSCELEFHRFDALQPGKHQDIVDQLSGRADVVLSTLVLEHLPIDVFFSTVKKSLKPQGILMLTNMHSEMGNMSQAGFLDAVTGEKIRGTSFTHTVDEMVKGAKTEGFSLVGEVLERGVEESDIVNGIVGQRGRKWVGVKVWYGCVMVRTTE